MTPRQSELLAFLIRFQEEHVFSPSADEIGVGLGMSSGRANVHLWALEDLGHIRRHGRAITILTYPEPVVTGRDERGSIILDVSGPRIIYGNGLRQPRVTAPQLGSLPATFEKMRNRA